MLFLDVPQSMWDFVSHYLIAQGKIIAGYIGACLLIALPLAIKKHEAELENITRPDKLFLFCFPKNLYFNRIAMHDFCIFLISPIFNIGMGLIFVSMPYVQQTTQKILSIYLPYGVLGHNTWFVHLSVLMIGFLCVDLIKYSVHRFVHSVPLLWEFHKTHHSSQKLTLLVTNRAHFLDKVPIDLLFITIALGFLDGIYQHCYIGASSQKLLIYLVFHGVINLVSGLQHSHHRVHFSPFWSKIFISPAMHFIHHSVDSKHYNKNLGGYLSIWDWLFGTLYIPSRQEKIEFGLGAESKEYETVVDFYVKPFQKIYRKIHFRRKTLAYQVVKSHSHVKSLRK